MVGEFWLERCTTPVDRQVTSACGLGANVSSVAKVLANDTNARPGGLEREKDSDEGEKTPLCSSQRGFQAPVIHDHPRGGHWVGKQAAARWRCMLGNNKTETESWQIEA